MGNVQNVDRFLLAVIIPSSFKSTDGLPFYLVFGRATSKGSMTPEANQAAAWLGMVLGLALFYSILTKMNLCSSLVFILTTNWQTAKLYEVLYFLL
jgi:hypothetical protein